MQYKRRRTFLVLIIALIISTIGVYRDTAYGPSYNQDNLRIKNAVTSAPQDSKKASDSLDYLAVKGRAPKTGYKRSTFMDDWRIEDNCDKRNIILQRDLRKTVVDNPGCLVLSGVLYDPYTGTNINFIRGFGTSGDVQIDHVVALSDAWQTGAQQFGYGKRNNFANDPLNLLAVDGPANQKKSDGDAATWLPPNKIYRCAYVARQIAVKLKYGLWVTEAEKDAMHRVLNNCPDQVLPIENE